MQLLGLAVIWISLELVIWVVMYARAIKKIGELQAEVERLSRRAEVR